LKIYLLTLLGTAIILLSFPKLQAEASANALEDEPRDPIIWNVSFEGNDNFSRIVLRDVIAARSPNLIRKLFRRYGDYQLNETELRRDRVRLIRYYERRGFDQVQVEVDIIPGENKEWKQDVVFRIREGEPIRITSSNVVIDAEQSDIDNIESIDQFQRDVRDHEFREGQRFQTVREPDVVGRFNQLMQNYGYPWAGLKLSQISIHSQKVPM